MSDWAMEIQELTFAYGMGRRQVGFFSLPSQQDEAVAWATLERMGIVDLAARPFDQLSGGQRQLVIFARALATEADPCPG